MAVVSTLVATALVVGAGAAVYGGIQSQKARKEQRRQNEVSNRIAATQRVRNVRQAVARGRVQRAEQEAAGFSMGVSGGTAVAGGVAGTQGAVNSAITGSNQQFTGQTALANISNRISQFQGNAQLAGDIGGIAGLFTGENIAAVKGAFA